MSDSPDSTKVITRSTASRVPFFVGVVALGLGLMVVWWGVRGNGPKLDDAPLPIVAKVPGFSLTERSGATVTRDDLLGKVWVVDFVFTSCAGPCPEMSMRMRSLQKTLIDTARDVTLVTITVDPKTDTPKVLARYAQKYHADEHRWLFLTGDEESKVRDLILKGFLQAIAPATKDTPIIHSTRFVLVDRRGRIRGFHDGLDVSMREQLLHDLDKLLHESDADD